MHDKAVRHVQAELHVQAVDNAPVVLVVVVHHVLAAIVLVVTVKVASRGKVDVKVSVVVLISPRHAPKVQERNVRVVDAVPLQQ